MTNCSIEDCDRTHEARGLCGTHYARLRRTGSTLLAARQPNICCIGECQTKVRDHGLCHMHYMRLQRTGTTDDPVRVSLAERIVSKVRVDLHGCWLWQGTVGPNGYGQMGAPGNRDRMAYAHRVSYETHVGPIPEGLQIDHLCRVRHCVNPGHLEPVTPAENVRRAVKARRQS